MQKPAQARGQGRKPHCRSVNFPQLIPKHVRSRACHFAVTDFLPSTAFAVQSIAPGSTIIIGTAPCFDDIEAAGFNPVSDQQGNRMILFGNPASCGAWPTT